MKAIILAAGEGVRPALSQAGRPTCLLEVGTTTLLNIQLDTLDKCGVTDIVLVRGYEKSQIDVPGIRYYDNDEHAATNVLHSLMVAEPELSGDVLILYSDIYYDENTIRVLLKSKHDITLGALVSHENLRRLKHQTSLADFELIDFDAENSIERIGKHLPETSEGTRGQFIGIFKLTDRGCRKLKNFFEFYRRQPDSSGRPVCRRAFITDMFSVMVDCGIDIRTSIVESGWFELNTPEDYQRLLTTQAVKNRYLATNTDWEKRSEKYDHLAWVNNDELLEHLAAQVEVTPETHLLDVGTGTGKVLIYLKLKKGDAHYYGADSSAAMMRKIDPAYEFVLTEADVTNLAAYSDGLFDYVTARMVFHHVDDVHRAMREIRRKLKDGGRLIVCEGNPPSYDSYSFYKEMFFYKEIRNVFMESDLINLFAAGGYRNITTRTVILGDMSLNNWIDNSGLPRRNIDIIKRMHYECSETVQRDYNMKFLGDDITMDWKFSIVIGEK